MTLRDFAVGLLIWLMVAVNAAPPRNCPLLVLDHGYFVAEVTSSDKQFYACDPGFKPSVGDWWGVITCTDGEWSSEPTCIPIQLNPPPSDNCMVVTRDHCGPIMAIENGKGEPVDGNSLRYSCQHGYRLEGSATVVCFRNGEWSNPPVCNAAVPDDTSLVIPGPAAGTIHRPVVQASVPTQPAPPNRSETSIEICGYLPNIPNARPEPYAWSVLYHCHPGYRLRGSVSRLYCYTDRTWSTPRPHCEACYGWGCRW